MSNGMDPLSEFCARLAVGVFGLAAAALTVGCAVSAVLAAVTVVGLPMAFGLAALSAFCAKVADVCLDFAITGDGNKPIFR